jgi:hypothetical protein
MVELRHKTLGAVGAPIESKEKEEPMSNIDLQSLIELGCIKEEVGIGNVKFLLRSLSATERMALAREFGSETLSDDALFNFNIKLLAMSIETINGQPLASFHPDPSQDELQVKAEIVSALQPPVIAKLLDSYANISARCDKQFGLEQVKN